jgi:hypothetical protein
MQIRRASTFILAVVLAGALGAIAARSASRSQSQLINSNQGEKVFDARRVRGPYEMPKILGTVPLGDDTGCYIVWNKSRVDLFRAGLTEENVFDCAAVWSEEFDDVQSIVPIGGKTTAFVIQTRDSHYIYKADWFPAY